MPHHFHLLLTVESGMTIERAMQFIKGGFSFRAGKELGIRSPIWQKDSLRCVSQMRKPCSRFEPTSATIQSHVIWSPILRTICGLRRIQDSNSIQFLMD